jgi:adenylylsulfate kinase
MTVPGAARPQLAPDAGDAHSRAAASSRTAGPALDAGDRGAGPDARALLVTGTVGVGKTSVAEAVGVLLAGRGVPHAVVDLDWLRRSWPSPAGDPFNLAITLRNLGAVTATFRGAGARRLVLAGVVQSRAEREEHQAAVGVPLAVCRLRVELPVVRERLTRRHELDAAGLRWHLARAGELDDILDRAGAEDVAVDATAANIPEVAQAVLGAVGW